MKYLLLIPIIGLFYFFIDFDSSEKETIQTKKIELSKKENIIEEYNNDEENIIVLTEVSTDIEKEIIKEKKEIIPQEGNYYIALNDLKEIHGDDLSENKINLLQREALILAQVLKVKSYYETNLESFDDNQLEKITSIIDNVDTVYEDLLYASRDASLFEEFFKEYQKMVRTI